MTPKTFRAGTMALCLHQVKHEMGRDAVILTTRTIQRAGLLGIGSRNIVEITAARNMSDIPRSQVAAAVGARKGRSADANLFASPGTLAGASRSIGEQILGEFAALKDSVASLVRESRRSALDHLPDGLIDHYVRLTQNAVADDLARDLVQKLRAELSTEQLARPDVVRARLARFLEPMIPTSGPIRIAASGEPTIVALIGPTGVGKTTTIAKLAANFCLREQRRVGLITIDTYRIAAVEQLRTYAQIIDVPLDVVSTPDQLRQAVARRADRDILLIDTAGRSQKDVIRVKELALFFQAVRPHEVHLVLSGTSGDAVLAQAVNRFREIGVNRIIFTKLDEAVGFGVVANCLLKAQTRLSYITTGQDVPDDIALADAAYLAKSIAGDPKA